MKNVFAFTAATPPSGYPAFVSLNKNEAGEYRMSVRTDGQQTPSACALSVEQLAQLAFMIAAELDCLK